MEKRSRSRRLSKPDNVEEKVILKTENAGQSPPKTVRLVCVLGTERKVVEGSVTGKRYEFIKNNPTEVDYEDAQTLLAIKRGGCCGNTPKNIFLQVT